MAMPVPRARFEHVQPHPVRRKGRGAPVFAFDPAAETMPRENLAALQLRRLRATLRNAVENVPLHRERMKELGVRPQDVRSLADVASLPFTVKDDLRRNYPFGMFARPRDALARLHASSGTTGKPTVVGYTRRDLDNWASLMARSMACTGIRPGDLLHNALGYGLFTGGLGLHDGAEKLGATVTPASGGFTERQVVLIRDFAARAITATPSYALAIAEVADQQGMSLRDSNLEIGLFGAEPWSEGMRRELEDRLGLRAYDVYGLSEVMGPGVAIECEAQDGLHAWEDHFLFEVIDPETGKPVKKGDSGELVITTLVKEALPMIRYRTRDITRMETKRCACGRTHARLRRITGRNDDMLIIRGVNVFPSQVESVLVGQEGLAPHYQLVVERKGAMDHVTVEAEALPGVPASRLKALADGARHHIKSMIGLTADGVVKKPGEIPRSQGKAVRVRDLRPKRD